jgi:hypothetical protein
MLKRKERPINLGVKGKIGIVFLVIISFLGLYLYSVYYPFLNNKLLWRDINIENLLLTNNGPIYSIDSGKVTVAGSTEELKPNWSLTKEVQNDSIIRLALFSQIDKESPLFGGPGLDINSFEQSVTGLAKSQNDLENVLGLTSDLYPIDFLQKVAEANKSEISFENDRSVQNANNLLKVDREAVVSYRTYVVNLRSKLANTKLPAGLFTQSGGITSEAIILGDLDKAAANASALDQEISNRSSCLNYSSFFCQRQALSLFNDYSDEKATTPTEIFPGDETLNGQSVVADGPFQVVTRCWRPTTSSPNVLLLYSLQSVDGKDLSSRAAGNIYFEKLSAEQFGIELYNQYLKHGVEWDVSSMDSGYTCNDMEYQPSLATISSYYEEFAQKSIFPQVDSLDWPVNIQKLIIASKNLEASFATEKYPSEMTLDKVAKSYAELYNSIVLYENQSGNNSAMDDLKDNLLYRFNYINNKMANYDKVINFLSYRTGSHAKTSEADPKGQTDMNYLYFMRNAYGLTLLGFSPSGWRSSTRMEYLDASTKISPSLVGYDEFVLKFGVDYAKKVISVNRNIIINELFKGIGS